MNRARLHTRLHLAGALATVSTFIVLALLSPGVLLLDPNASTAVLIEGAWTVPVLLALGAIATEAMLRPFGGSLRMIDQGDGDGVLDAAAVRSLHALPRRWVSRICAQTVGVVALTVLPPLRPSLIDRDTQLAVLTLAVTVTAASALPLYVIVRAIVGSTLELISWRICEQSLARAAQVEAEDFRAVPRERWSREGRVAGRLVYAMALPVALVALATSLLANAHVRAYEARRRREDAFVLARGILDSEGDAEGIGLRGAEEAVQAAATLGFEISKRRDETSDPHSPHNTSGARDVTATFETPTLGGARSLEVPLQDGRALVRFAPNGSADTSFIELYALAGALAVAVAALLGRAFGRFVSRDIADAAREVRLLGTEDVLRGATRVAGPARFAAVGRLGLGIEAVAERFREFAHGRERMIDARESAQKMRDLFLASMSHDLRSPLNGILGFVALLQKAGLSPPQHESLGIIERRGRELLELIENILDAAKIEAGRLDLGRDWTLASELLTEAVRRGRELALEKAAANPGSAVEVIGELQSGIVPVLLDAQRLTKAIINVVANAVKFCDQGVVRVRVSQGRHPRDGGDAIRIDVTDQGRGIPERELAQIFDAFRQPIRSRRHGGLGIGLSMTRAIVELHGGTIDVASTPDQGSVFTLWIPMLAGAAGEALERAADMADTMRIEPLAFDSGYTPVARAARDADPTVEMPALEVPPSREPDDPSELTARVAPRPAAGTPAPRAAPVAQVSPPKHASVPPSARGRGGPKRG